MHRYQFRAHCRENVDPKRLFPEALPVLKTKMKTCDIRQLSLFHFGNQLFLYYESPAQSVDPHMLFQYCEAALSSWPGSDLPRKWVPMIDIFHYQKPISENHWQRKNPSSKPYARIARLKPEKVASYVFYHYQYQEEKPGDGDKYGLIGLHENLMFFYSEDPATVENPPYSGKLFTSNTPSDWMGAMTPHFIPWNLEKDPSLLWLEIPLLVQL